MVDLATEDEEVKDAAASADGSGPEEEPEKGEVEAAQKAAANQKDLPAQAGALEAEAAEG
jgi:hypothetical protein